MIDEKTKKTIVEKFRAGFSAKRVSRECGVSNSSALKIGHSAGLVFRKGPNTPWEPKRKHFDMFKRAKALEPYQSIGDDYGISRQRVEQIVKKMGFKPEGRKKTIGGWRRK